MKSTKPILVLNTGWMNRYQGLKGDPIVGGGEYVVREDFGHEVLNFKPHRGRLYGYAQPVGSTIRLQNLGAASSAGSIGGVLVVWTAAKPSGGRFVVGWYDDATVFREWQSPPIGASRTVLGHKVGYRVVAKASTCRLLGPDERTLAVPRGKGGIGRSNVWYANSRRGLAFRKRLLTFVNECDRRTNSGSDKLSKQKGYPRQPDIEKRLEVERRAMKSADLYFDSLGYTVKWVHKENLGWDLEARRHDIVLKVEVKGLSDREVVVFVTPNEFRAMRVHRSNYRVCVVTSALTKKAKLSVFGYSDHAARWESEQGQVLKIMKIEAAKLSV